MLEFQLQVHASKIRPWVSAEFGRSNTRTFCPKRSGFSEKRVPGNLYLDSSLAGTFVGGRKDPSKSLQTFRAETYPGDRTSSAHQGI